MDISALSLQFFCTGLTIGSIYALIALGFTIIFNASGIVNFAQGEFVMLGALVAVTLVGDTAAPLAWYMVPAAVILSTLLVAGFAGLLQLVFIRPLTGRPVLTAIILTIGASIAIHGVAMLVWGKDALPLPPLPGPPVLAVGSAVVPFQSVWVLGVSLVAMLALRLFFDRTLIGRAMRANAANREGALLVGINPQRIVLLSFILSGALGAGAGALIAPSTLATYDMGTMLGLKGFAAAILGGLGSSPGAILGGLLLGLLESFGAGFLPTGLSGYKDAVAFVVVLLVLFLRPSGLLGSRKVKGL